MNALNGRKLGLAIAGLAVAATASAYGLRADAHSEHGVAAIVKPIPGLACGWEGNPCQLEALVVTANAQG